MLANICECTTCVCACWRVVQLLHLCDLASRKDLDCCVGPKGWLSPQAVFRLRCLVWNWVTVQDPSEGSPWPISVNRTSRELAQAPGGRTHPWLSSGLRDDQQLAGEVWAALACEGGTPTALCGGGGGASGQATQGTRPRACPRDPGSAGQCPPSAEQWAPRCVPRESGVRTAGWTGAFSQQSRLVEPVGVGAAVVSTEETGAEAPSLGLSNAGGAGVVLGGRVLTKTARG